MMSSNILLVIPGEELRLCVDEDNSLEMKYFLEGDDMDLVQFSEIFSFDELR